jgi:transposase
MVRAPINPDPACVHIEGIRPDADGLTIIMRTSRPSVPCPDCEQLTERVHSWYQRTIADLPWQGLAVRFQLHTRRWFCDQQACSRQIFTERLPDLAASYARRTLRLAEVVEAIAFALGGEAGHRLLLTLGLMLSPDTLLNVIRTTVLPPGPPPRVVGIDDWAWRRRDRYGTILVDLERQRAIDLLADREPETVTAWLQQYPDIEVIARDRGQGYIEAATLGAPQALQVADRWHLVHNLHDVLEDILLSKRHVLRTAAHTIQDAPELSERSDDFASGPIMPKRPRRGAQRAEERSHERHERIVARWETIRRLHLAGADVADIARRVGVSRETVYRYRKLDEPPERRHQTPRKRALDAYIPYLLQRWHAGCHNGMQLWREIREQGYPHGEGVVGRFVAELRREEAAGHPVGASARRRATPVPTARHVASLFVRRPAKLTSDQERYLSELRRRDELLTAAYELTQSFTTMLRERTGEQLEAWIEQAKTSEIGRLSRFAGGLEKDRAAVQAGLTEEWSNGQTEGHIHRLKLLKRQMYGRAGFDVLRPRVIRAA